MFGVGALGSWLLSPLGKVAIVVAAFLLWTTYQRHDAAKSARAECQAEQLQKTLAEVVRQRDAAKAALALAEKQAAVTRKEVAELEQENDKIAADLGEAAKAGCRIPRATTKRLRNIR